MLQTNIKFNIEKRELIRFLGNGNNKVVSAAADRHVNKINGKIKKLVEPEVNYQIHQIKNIKKNRIDINEKTLLKSFKLARALRDADFVCCYIATIGSEIEEEVDDLMNQKRFSEAFVLDSMGSVAVESTLEQFHSQMKDNYKARKMAITQCYSPGYCDWTIKEQKKIFQMFDDDINLNVSLSDSYMMSPCKSISGTFGILPHDKHKSVKNYNPCSECKKTNCNMRRN